MKNITISLKGANMKDRIKEAIEQMGRDIDSCEECSCPNLSKIYKTALAALKTMEDIFTMNENAKGDQYKLSEYTYIIDKFKSFIGEA